MGFLDEINKIKRALKRGFRIEQYDRYVRAGNLPYAMCVAIGLDSLDRVGELIQIGIELNTSPNDVTPLGYAIMHNSHSAAAYLIQCGADPNSVFGKKSPIHTAAALSDPKMIDLLVQSGADINTPDDFGFRPIEYAKKANLDDNVKRITELMNAK